MLSEWKGMVGSTDRLEMNIEDLSIFMTFKVLFSLSCQSALDGVSIYHSHWHQVLTDFLVQYFPNEMCPQYFREFLL